MNKYKKNDLLIDKDGNKRKVLEVLGDLVFYHYIKDNVVLSGIAIEHYKEIDQNYTVEQARLDRLDKDFIRTLLKEQREEMLKELNKTYGQGFEDGQKSIITNN